MRRRDLLTATATSALAAGTAALATAAPASAHGEGRGAKGRVRTGFETLRGSGYASVTGQRVGIISNPTGIDRQLNHIVDVMVADEAVNLVAIFGPEHGFRGIGQAGEGEEFFIDEKTGLPVYNAYNNSATMERLFSDLQLDTVVFDIQEVGARFYTYIWTMYLALEAAARLGVKFVVLDRPTPLSGRDAYGPVLHPEHSTFVGLKAIAQQHGMTPGELARLYNEVFVPAATGGKRADLHVQRLSGWDRRMRYVDTGLPWVAPSPNMPTLATADIYVGTCLFEATALSEGRGTTQPFQLIGAPGIDHRWGEALNAREMPGVRFREAYFKPVFSKQQDKTCGGVEVQITDIDRFEPIPTALAMITEQWRLFPEYGWRSQDVTSFWMDKLSGNTGVREAIENGTDAADIPEVWHDDLRQFRALRKEFLIYR